MSDNDPDDRFSMPPIEGVWDGAGRDGRPVDEPDPEEEATPPRGLTLPPPGLFARLDEPEPAEAHDLTSDAVADVDEPVVEDIADEDFADEDFADEEAADEDAADEPADSDAVFTSEPAPAPVGLAGIADAVDIIEQLSARIEAEHAASTPPAGDDLVYADAADFIAATQDDDEESEPIRLPSYAALASVDEPVATDEPDDAGEPEPQPTFTLPMYGDGDRRDDDEEILPHFLLEDSAPLDIVAAQEQLREMAHKNRKKADDDEHRPSLARTLAEIPVLLIVAAVIAFLVKTFLAQAYYIPSGSMIPQLQIDDRVVVSKLAYKVHDPRRGDIVVFDDPRSGEAKAAEDSNLLRKIGEGVGVVQPSTDEFIKRVIGLPGETVSGHDGYVYINGHKLIEPYLPRGVETDDFGQQTVASGKLWVMGDNRSGSADSRVFGQIKIDSIVGRAVVKVWPFSHISFL